MLTESQRIKSNPQCIGATYIFRCGYCTEEFDYTITEYCFPEPPVYCTRCRTQFEINKASYTSLIVENKDKTAELQAETDSEVENPDYNLWALSSEDLIEEMQKSKFRKPQAIRTDVVDIYKCGYCGHGFVKSQHDPDRPNYCRMCGGELQYSE